MRSFPVHVDPVLGIVPLDIVARAKFLPKFLISVVVWVMFELCYKEHAEMSCAH